MEIHYLSSLLSHFCSFLCFLSSTIPPKFFIINIHWFPLFLSPTLFPSSNFLELQHIPYFVIWKCHLSIIFLFLFFLSGVLPFHSASLLPVIDWSFTLPPLVVYSFNSSTLHSVIFFPLFSAILSSMLYFLLIISNPLPFTFCLITVSLPVFFLL